MRPPVLFFFLFGCHGILNKGRGEKKKAELRLSMRREKGRGWRGRRVVARPESKVEKVWARGRDYSHPNTLGIREFASPGRFPRLGMYTGYTFRSPPRHCGAHKAPRGTTPEHVAYIPAFGIPDYNRSLISKTSPARTRRRPPPGSPSPLSLRIDTVPRCSPSIIKNTTRGQATYQSASLSIVTGSPETQSSGTARENVESKGLLLLAFQIPRPKQTPHLLVASGSTAAPALATDHRHAETQPGVWSHTKLPGPPGGSKLNSTASGTLYRCHYSTRGAVRVVVRPPPPTGLRDPLVTRSPRASRQPWPGSSAASKGFPVPETAAREA